MENNFYGKYVLPCLVWTTIVYGIQEIVIGSINSSSLKENKQECYSLNHLISFTIYEGLLMDGILSLFILSVYLWNRKLFYEDPQNITCCNSSSKMRIGNIITLLLLYLVLVEKGYGLFIFSTCIKNVIPEGWNILLLISLVMQCFTFIIWEVEILSRDTEFMGWFCLKEKRNSRRGINNNDYIEIPEI